MKGERPQDGFWSGGERPFKYSAGDRAVGMEMSQSESVAFAAAEFIIAGGARWEAAGPFNRTYFNRTVGEQQAFLVLREGDEERTVHSEKGDFFPLGPCLIRSEEWLRTPELSVLYSGWLFSEDELQTKRTLQRLGYRMRAVATELLESSDGCWTAVTLPFMPELAEQPERLATLQDAQLEALFTALAEHQRQGGESRLDLLAPYPASTDEFAAMREFIEEVAEQTLGHAYAAACRIGALIAPVPGRLSPGKSRVSPISSCWTARLKNSRRRRPPQRASLWRRSRS